MSLLINAATKHQAGKLAEASKLYNKYIKKNAESVEALSLFGLCMQDMGNYRRAETLFSIALRADNTRFDLYQNRGNTRLQMGKLIEALSDFEAGLSISPNDIDSLKNAGNICIKLNKFDRAFSFFKRAFKLNSKEDNIIAGLAFCLSMRALQTIKEKKFNAAINDLNEAHKLCPDSWEIIYNLGNAYLKSGNYQSAQHQYEKALKLNKTNVQLLCNKGIASERLGAFSKAATAYKKALVLDPKNHPAAYNYSLLMLKLGFYEKGWDLYENRWETPEFTTAKRQFNVPLWQGDYDLTDKKILCHAEQGLGDTIQFLRFCTMFDTKKTKVLVQCHSDLIEIAQTMQLQAEFYETGSDLPDYDFHCPLMSLPRAFKYRPDRQKKTKPYLFPHLGKKEQFDKILGPRLKPRVGLVLEGKTSHVHNHLRSMNASDFIKILPQGVNYFLLQKELSSRTKDLIRNRPDVRNLSKLLSNFSDTAAACANMDLIISVDTAVAHLAGAIGCRTTLLLHYQSDWRWGLETKTSHWYPNMRLIRLQRNSEWSATYAEISTTIESIL